jgi:acetyl-CoA carboxylase carboxyl transferase subunit alpha
MALEWLDFERPIFELEEELKKLRDFPSSGDPDQDKKIRSLEKKLTRTRKDIFAKLTPWQRVLLARHPLRPYTLDYLKIIAEEFMEIHGDRNFGDDKAMIVALSRIEGRSVMVVGQQKGRGTKDNLQRNFGMPHPEGYRKALRAFDMAAKFGKPILCLVDTPGAHCDIGAEERGQSEAIARNLREMAVLPVPVIIIIIGEGASGGALGIGVGDRVLMLENTWYSVISPEGCAAILWRDRSKAAQTADALKLTAKDLLKLGIIDEIIPEPEGGAHRDHKKAAGAVKEVFLRHLAELETLPPDELIARRIEKFGQMGAYKQD